MTRHTASLTASIVVMATLWMVPRASAQGTAASLNGLVTDESNAVLPGATVTATDLATGRQYVAVTDERGEYRLVPMSAGTYSVTVELAGFSPVTVRGLELLVGQDATRSFVLGLAQIEEAITVTGESPLIDLRTSEVTGNVDRRQMEELPLQGRNWMELSMLVKGITANNVSNSPGVGQDDLFQLNLDGQQVTQKIGGSGFGQPRFSRDAISEFQIVTHLYDITQGRSTGIQVQAVSKTGTNDLGGSVFGYFRDDSLNAPDPIADEVLPYSNQQVGGTVGGPIVRDKVHYFGSFEYEREPQTVVSQPTFLPGQSFATDSKGTRKTYLARLDYQHSADDHMSLRWTRSNWENPFVVGGTQHPSNATAPSTLDDSNLLFTWSRIFDATVVGELRFGYNTFTMFQGVPDEVFGTPEYRFPGLTIGAGYNRPFEFSQNNFQLRYDLTLLKGSHDIKIGGEYLHVDVDAYWHLQKAGIMVFTDRPPDLNERFPQDAAMNPSAWNLTGLDSLVERFDQNFHPNDWFIDIPRPTVAIWFGDNWRVNDRLTVNYGIRWDDDWGATAPPGIADTSIPISNGFEEGDFGFKANIRDHNNFAPRGGFAWDVTGDTTFVIRGGSGLYYSLPPSNVTYSHQLYNQMVAGSFANDGLPGFVDDPLRGRTDEDILSGAVAVPAQAPRIIDPKYQMPKTWQSGIGFQKQLGDATAIDSDLIHWIWYNDTRTYDPNLFFDPATGYNLNPSQGRPNPEYSQITWFESTGRRDYMALASSIRRRFKDDFQVGATYTLMFYQHDDGGVGFNGGPANNNFDHLDGEWARSTDFQRHTLRLNGLYQLPWGVSVSGIYFFGSGNYYNTNHSSRPYGKAGTNRLNLGAPVAIPDDVQDRFDGPSVIGTGELVPRNALKGLAINKVDVRLTKDFNLGSGVRVSLLAEVFNVFNHKNYGNYVTSINSASFGQPRSSSGNAYFPRTGQFGFRITY